MDQFPCTGHHNIESLQAARQQLFDMSIKSEDSKGISEVQLRHAVDVTQVLGGGTGVEEENLACEHSITLHQLYGSTFKFHAQQRKKCHGI